MLINPSIRQLEVFITVAREQSFSRAAGVLNLSQPALSQTVAQLEALVEARLFDRTTRSVRLTAIGEDFLPKIKQVLAGLNVAVLDARRVSRLDDGQVQIACLASMSYRFLPNMIQEFNRLHPGVKVAIRDAVTADIPALLTSGQAELALSSTTDIEGFEFQPLMQDLYRLVCRRDHPLARRTTVTWSELNRHSLIAMTPDTAIRHKMDAAFLECGIRIRPAYEVARLITVFGMVESGLGITALPALNCPRESFGALVDMPLIEPVVEQTIGLLTRTGRSLSPAAAAFRDLMVHSVTTAGLGTLPATSVVQPPTMPSDRGPRRRTPRALSRTAP